MTYKLDPDLESDYKDVAWNIIQELDEKLHSHELQGVPGAQERFEIWCEIYSRLLPEEFDQEDFNDDD